MPFYDVTCGAHDSLDVFAPIGAAIPCPTCGAPTARLWSTSAGIEDVTWPGGKVFENLGHESVRCDSPADLKRELKARNLEPRVRHVDGDRHVGSWSAMSQATLDGAKAMLERVGKASDAKPGTWIESMTVTVTDESGVVWAPRGTFGVSHAR